MSNRLTVFMDNKTNIVGESSIMLYTNSDNTIQLEVKLEQETVWLTQKQMAALFDVKKAAISKHISNIYAQGELVPEATVSKMETVHQLMKKMHRLDKVVVNLINQDN